jgi:iron complex outermembrane receptor protein
MSKWVSAFSLLATLAPFAAHAEPAASSDDADGVAQVVVTAQKRENRIADIPAPISVISGAEVAGRGISDFEGLVENVPGVSITSDFGGGASKVVSVRGVGGTDDYRPNGSPSVGFHVDNIYQTSNVFLLAPFFDVQRVEVLKGPQGTLYGRNSTAGVINLITRGPGDEFNGYALAEYSSYERSRAEGAIGGPLTDKVGLRIAALVDKGGGFMDGKGAGAFAGRVFFPRTPAVTDPGARGGWGDRDLTALRATLEYSDADFGDVSVKTYTSSDRGENQLADSQGGFVNNGWLEPDNDPYTFYSNRYPVRDIQIDGASASYKRPIGDTMAFDFVAGVQGADREWSGSSGTPRRSFDYDFTDRVRQRSFEARLSSTDERFDWVVGAYNVSDKVNFVTLLLSADVRATNGLSNYSQKRDSSAVFGQFDWRFLERATLTAGLRYTQDDGSYIGSTIDLDPWGVTTYPQIFPELPVFFNKSSTDEDTSGRITLAFDLTEDLKIYGAVATGYKAGGFDGSTIFSVAEAEAFDPETVLSYEAGLKYSGPRRLFIALDAFSYEFEELQAFTVIPLPGGGTSPNLRINVGRSELMGLDASVGFDLVRSDRHDLRFDIAGTFLRSEILEFEGTPLQVAQNLGNDLPAAPKFSGNASLAYSFRPGGDWRLGATLDVRNKSSEFKRLNNNLGSQVEGYTLFNLRAEINNEASGWGVYAFGRNLTEEIYFLDRNAGGRLVGPPRTFGAGLRFDF